jgi:hypothetical protein
MGMGAVPSADVGSRQKDEKITLAVPLNHSGGRLPLPEIPSL